MRNVLITGASSGIGAACAKEFAANGDRVFLNYNTGETAAKQLADEIGGIAIKADITDKAQISAAVDLIHSDYGRVHTIVNNAGISSIKMFSDISADEWDEMFAVNVRGMFLVTRAFLTDMIHEKSGRIINISSIWGICGASCEVHYSSSKAAVIGLTRSLAKELGPSAVTVNCVAPGFIDTRMNAHLTEEERNDFISSVPLGRAGRPEEVAKLVLFLASDDAGYITGQVIGADGGLS